MFEQTFKNIDNVLYQDAGCDSELDYIEQTSWVLFLRYLEQLEEERKDEAQLENKTYKPILDEEYRWDEWAAPKKSDGTIDYNEIKTGDDLVEFVDHDLFPYLARFKERSRDTPKSIEYKIGEIFGELENKIKSGYNLREVLDQVDKLSFVQKEEKEQLHHLYESKIKNMGNAGRNGGQYYTPRPLIRAMVQVTDPHIGETVYDGAAGSAGFLCEAFAYMQERMEEEGTTDDLEKLHKETFYGKEKKNLAYVVGVMNMILHGIETPNLKHVNTLNENIRDIQEKDRSHVILANPPFGGKERKEVQQNFDIKTGETAFLFLQHFIRSLKADGRAAIVIKNTFLSNSDAADLRKYLLETCNLHTILDMPQGTFTGAGVQTVVLFFQKGEPTKRIWYYDLDPGRSLGKTDPLTDQDFEEFLELQPSKQEDERSWTLDVSDLDENYDLSVKNPNKEEDEELRDPQAILEEMENLDEETKEIVNSLKKQV